MPIETQYSGNTMENEMKLPAGEYYVGDLCYLIASEEWNDFCEAVLFRTDGGVVQTKGWRNWNSKLGWHNTAYGDGIYYDQFGNEYWVDAGIIGCFHLGNLTENDADPRALTVNGGCIVHEFKEEFDVWCENGKIHIGELCIDTDPSDYEY